MIEYHHGITPRRSPWDHSPYRCLGVIPEEVSGITPGEVFRDHSQSSFLGITPRAVFWDHSQSTFLGSLPEQFSGITPGAIFWDHSWSSFQGSLPDQFSGITPGAVSNLQFPVSALCNGVEATPSARASVNDQSKEVSISVSRSSSIK